MGLMGMFLTFMPDQVLIVLGQMPNSILNICLQLTGALYLGFAMTNWMAKTLIIGGIYARPLTIGNFFHFLIAGLALVKLSFITTATNMYIYVLTVIYSIFAILFGYVFMAHPTYSQTE